MSYYHFKKRRKGDLVSSKIIGDHRFKKRCEDDVVSTKTLGDHRFKKRRKGDLVLAKTLGDIPLKITVRAISYFALKSVFHNPMWLSLYKAP